LALQVLVHLLAELFQHLFAVAVLFQQRQAAADRLFRLIDLPKTVR
jgi:hypothetical protein